MVVSEKFHSDVVKFQIDGIKMIGNNRSGAIIGLDENGSKFVEGIIEGENIDITEDNQILYKAFKDGQF